MSYGDTLVFVSGLGVFIALLAVAIDWFMNRQKRHTR